MRRKIIQEKFNALRLSIARAINPTSQPEPHRYVAIRFFPAGVSPQVVVFDRQNDEHCKAWNENQRCYPCQIIASGGDYGEMKKLETFDD